MNKERIRKVYVYRPKKTNIYSFKQKGMERQNKINILTTVLDTSKQVKYISKYQDIPNQLRDCTYITSYFLWFFWKDPNQSSSTVIFCPLSAITVILSYCPVSTPSYLNPIWCHISLPTPRPTLHIIYILSCSICTKNPPP